MRPLKPFPPRRWSSTSYFVVSRKRARLCTRTFWRGTAALVPDDAVGTLRRDMFRGGDMILQSGLRALVCAALVSLGTMSLARAEGTYEIPAGAHFNPDKLARITEFFKNEVATGKIAGANVLIKQHGKPVYHEVFGVQDAVSKTPITDRTIFRLFSMSKAITSVVAVKLIEEGAIKLDDPVSKYIPSFANVKVGVEKKAEDGTKSLDLVPPNRPMTVHDLMTHTSGVTYGFYATAWSARPIAMPTSMPAISTSRSSPSASQNFRCTTSRARCGNTAIPPTSWRGSWKWRPASRSSRSSGRSCSTRSAWSIPASSSPIPRSRSCWRSRCRTTAISGSGGSTIRR